MVKASKDEISMMREWVRSHGSSVRQKRVRQATMARAGTLPDFCTKRKSKLEKESTFLQTVWQPQTSAQYPASLMQKTKLPCTVQTEMKKFVRLEILRRTEGTSGLGNQQITGDVDFHVGRAKHCDLGFENAFSQPANVINILTGEVTPPCFIISQYLKLR